MRPFRVRLSFYRHVERRGDRAVCFHASLRNELHHHALHHFRPHRSQLQQLRSPPRPRSSPALRLLPESPIPARGALHRPPPRPPTIWLSCVDSRHSPVPSHPGQVHAAAVPSRQQVRLHGLHPRLPETGQTHPRLLLRPIQQSQRGTTVGPRGRRCRNSDRFQPGGDRDRQHHRSALAGVET